ncbi:FAD/NAD(P)-binding domain-containing protein [Polychaeton citri CBS 116435]|uniref:FAD/NAD(P)-binding domain-containing protein n=1 Tax=Polychaeton citri CBS 116435 TaxID=1314669 RepID=A0A9P4QD48_9PEZI|nr:FAD/NAD(P)-binding domain-containing protein [Polychaeton citri CBS 116435]
MHVLVSGAGIAGPALAWFLAKTGAHVTVLEKSGSFRSQGQNVDIDGGAVTVIKKMGLLDEVRRFNTTEAGTQFIDPKGRPFAFFPVGKDSSASPTSEFEILRGDLAAIFYNATKDHPNVDYEFGTTVKKVVSNGDDAVKVELSNEKVQEFDILVAADGQWSNVRKQCFPSEDVKVVDKNLYTIYWTVPRLPRDNDWWNIYNALGSRVISLRPDPYNTIRAAITKMPSTEAQKKMWLEASRSDRQTQVELLRREFSDAGWEAHRLLDSLDQTDDLYFHPLQQIKMSKWSNSRVVCIGDAAHAPTPLTGMGTSLAVIGAYILAGELSKLKEGEHPARALETYDSTFRPFVEKIQNLPFFVPAIAHPGTAWKRWLLQSLVWVISKAVAIPWVARIFDPKDDQGFPLPEYPGFDDRKTK